MLVMNFMLLAEFEMDNVIMKKRVGLALQDGAEHVYCFFNSLTIPLIFYK